MLLCKIADDIHQQQNSCENKTILSSDIKCEVGYLWPQKEHRISETLKYNILFGGNC
jgi:hypothetical protein